MINVSGVTNRLLAQQEIDAGTVAALRTELDLARATCLALMESHTIYWCLTDEQCGYLGSLGAAAQVARCIEDNPELPVCDAPTT